MADRGPRACPSWAFFCPEKAPVAVSPCSGAVCDLRAFGGPVLLATPPRCESGTSQSGAVASQDRRSGSCNWDRPRWWQTTRKPSPASVWHQTVLPGQSAKSLSRGKRRPFRRKRKGQAPRAGYGAEWLVEGNQVVCDLEPPKGGTSFQKRQPPGEPTIPVRQLPCSPDDDKYSSTRCFHQPKLPSAQRCG